MVPNENHKYKSDLSITLVYHCTSNNINANYQEKKEEIWLSPMTKAPTPTEKSKKQCDNTKTPPKTSITQRLRIELGRSVGVTIAIQLVWLSQLTGSQLSYSSQQLCKTTT